MHNILKQTSTGWQIAASYNDLENVLLDPSLVLSSQGRINLHYTCHHVLPEGQRSFSHGEWLFFDFDDISIEPTRAAPLLATALEDLLDVNDKSFQIVSGRGVHILFRMQQYSEAYLDIHKSTYTHIANELEKKVTEFSFKIDPIFHKAKSLRLPGTVNRKENMTDVECFLLRGSLDKTVGDYLTTYRLKYDPSFKLEEEIKKAEAVKQSAKIYALPVLSSTGEQVNSLPSKDSIIEKCSFVSSLQSELANLPRDEWFKGVSLLTTLGMDEEAHSWSSSSPLYKASEVQSIIEGVRSKGLFPMSCNKIMEVFNEELTSKCHDCPYKSCRSPANLHNDPLLAVMGAGFKVVHEGKKAPSTDFDSLSNFMAKYLSVVYVKDRKSFYQWNMDAQLYEEKTEAEVTNIACRFIKPRVIDPQSHINKIAGAIEVNASKEEKKMLAPDGTIPLSNGLFYIQSSILEPYTPKILTTNKLNYIYDPLADCPHFDRFLEERIGDKELIDSLMLFLCYSLAGIKQPIRKILVLEGPAATGKSTLLTVISRIFGDLSFYGQLQNLVGRFETASFIDKRIVLFDEAISARDYALIEVLKNLSGSETIKIEKKNKDPQNIANFARIVIACNEIPRGGAMDSGFLDRLLIIPMHNTLDYSQRDYEEITKILSEGSGILNKILSYYAKLKDLNFVIPHPKLSQDAIEEYQESDASLVTFIKQNCDFVPIKKYENLTEVKTDCHRPNELHGIALKDLRNAVTAWGAEEGEAFFETISTRVLSKLMQDLAKSTYRYKMRSFVDADNRRYFVGIVFKDKKKHSPIIQKKDCF